MAFRKKKEDEVKVVKLESDDSVISKTTRIVGGGETAKSETKIKEE